MIVFDIDHFSLANEILGTKACDDLLHSIGAAILAKGLHSTEYLVAGHIEADHFAVLNDPNKLNPEDICKDIQDWLAIAIESYHMTGRIGVYDISDRKMDPGVMLDRAMTAIRAAKATSPSGSPTITTRYGKSGWRKKSSTKR